MSATRICAAQVSALLPANGAGRTRIKEDRVNAVDGPIVGAEIGKVRRHGIDAGGERGGVGWAAADHSDRFAGSQ
jgi:hypothetical protein